MKYYLIPLVAVVAIFCMSMASAYTVPPSNNVTIVLPGTYTAPNYSNVTIVLVTSSAPAPPGDTCTPVTGQNWNIAWADNCTVSQDWKVGNVTLTGVGRFMINANLTFESISYFPTSTTYSQVIYFTGARLISK